MDGLCRACTATFKPSMRAFCYECKAPRSLDWTTGNRSLDSFILESWNNTKNEDDAYIQWIEYSLLSNVQTMTPLHHGCTHIADWLEPMYNRRTKVVLKKIVSKHDGQAFDFHQVIFYLSHVCIASCIKSINVVIHNILSCLT